MREPFADYYALLGVPEEASASQLRRAFRKRLFEVHPDKGSKKPQSLLLARILRAFETLSDPDARERYDRLRRIQILNDGNASSIAASASALPHVTESSRPKNRARAILYLLLKRRAAEAASRLRALPGGAAAYLARYLEAGEFVDAAFLLGEHFERKRMREKALFWYQEILRRERRRKFRRPCYEETCERAKRLLIRRLDVGREPRVTLAYLERAEGLGLSKLEQARVSKLRALCFLALGLPTEAARSLRKALELYPRLTGIRRLEGALRAYL
ncbi:MAG: J domain-containing protein [Planctomycetes bacterium]|nr:J domain-containing protein [Planctomycetota bacterium]